MGTKGIRKEEPPTSEEANYVEKVRQSLTPLQQSLVVDISTNFIIGAHWAVFHKSAADYRAKQLFYKNYVNDPAIQIVKRPKGAVGTDGFVVVSSFSDLLTFTSQVIGQAEAMAIYKNATASNAATIARCEKDILLALQGKKDMTVVGLYSVNTTDTITVGNKSYPAYRLTLESYVAILQGLGFRLANVSQLASTLTVSSTGTGAFVSNVGL